MNYSTFKQSGCVLTLLKRRFCSWVGVIFRGSSKKKIQIWKQAIARWNSKHDWQQENKTNPTVINIKCLWACCNDMKPCTSVVGRFRVSNLEKWVPEYVLVMRRYCSVQSACSFQIVKLAVFNEPIVTPRASDTEIDCSQVRINFIVLSESKDFSLLHKLQYIGTRSHGRTMCFKSFLFWSSLNGLIILKRWNCSKSIPISTGGAC